MKKMIDRRKYPVGFKQDAVKLAEKVGVSEASDQLGVPLSTLQRWKYKRNKLPVEKSTDILRLQLEIKSLKKKNYRKRRFNRDVEESHNFFFKGKRKMIFKFILKYKPKALSFKEVCRFFKVSPSGFFKHRRAESPSNKVTPEEVASAFYAHKARYGYRKIAKFLSLQEGRSCSPAQVRRLLSQLGLKARKPKKFKPLSKSEDFHYPIAQRVFKIEETQILQPNQVWGSDITYLRAKGQKFFYLAIFMDFYSRQIVGWDLSHSLSSELVLRAFEKALKTRSVTQGLIVHSDRGVQYSSKEFRQSLENLGFVQSMSRKGNCYDNAYCESWFSLLKRELKLKNKAYSSINEARLEVFQWIEAWYNTKRLHSSLDYKSPMNFEKINLTMDKKPLNLSPLI